MNERHQERNAAKSPLVEHCTQSSKATIGFPSLLILKREKRKISHVFGGGVARQIRHLLWDGGP